MILRSLAGHKGHIEDTTCLPYEKLRPTFWMQHPITIPHPFRNISVLALCVCVCVCVEGVGIGCVGMYVKAVEIKHLIEFPSTLENCYK